MNELHHPLTIRLAGSADRPALMRLAALDSAALPAGPLLVAEADGDLRAALSLWDGRAVADPFQRTAHAVSLLRHHAEQARPPRAAQRRWLSGVRLHRPAPAPARWRAA